VLPGEVQTIPTDSRCICRVARPLNPREMQVPSWVVNEQAVLDEIFTCSGPDMLSLMTVPTEYSSTSGKHNEGSVRPANPSCISPASCNS
jgi:hypothetical protein